jgi:hypothetical protein
MKAAIDASSWTSGIAAALMIAAADARCRDRPMSLDPRE